MSSGFLTVGNRHGFEGGEAQQRLKAFFAPVMAQRHIGITLQIDVGPEVFDAKHSNLHPLFNKV